MGVAEVDLGVPQIGLLRLDRRGGLGALSLQHVDLAFGGLDLGAVLQQLCGELLAGGRQSLSGLDRGRADGDQLALACGVAGVLGQVG